MDLRRSHVTSSRQTETDIVGHLAQLRPEAGHNRFHHHPYLHGGPSQCGE